MQDAPHLFCEVDAFMRSWLKVHMRRLAKLIRICSSATPEHNEGIFVELEDRVQALYRPYLPKGIPERTLLLLISFMQARTEIQLH